MFCRLWQRGGTPLLFGRIVIAVLSLLTISVVAHAKVRVSGARVAMIVDARNASLNEVVGGINAAFDARISLTSTINLTINGRYIGSLRQVLSRMLDGHNYILHESGERITIILLTSTGTMLIERPYAKAVPAIGVSIDKHINTNGDTKASFDQPVHGWAGGFVYRRSTAAH
jgi:hypothetical protein